MHSPQQKFDLIRLLRSKNIDFDIIIELIKKGECPSQIIKRLIKSGFNNIACEKSIETELVNITKYDAKIITIFDENYPFLLRNINNPPLILTIKGNIDLFKEQLIAIVGARNASYNAMNFARKISYEISQNNIVTVSGLARGIDSAVHDSSINHRTIAVIAGGINNIYPKCNKYLYELIANNGLIISESCFNDPPLPQKFISRNRIISGLSMAIIIIEAGARSGSLSTANFANNQGRYVFAVPGAPYDDRSKGSNNLIRDGAIMLESIDDIFNELEFIKEKTDNIRDESLPKDTNIDLNESAILKILDYNGVPLEYLIYKLKANISDINSILINLELKNKIYYQGGKIYLKKNIF